MLGICSEQEGGRVALSYGFRATIEVFSSLGWDGGLPVILIIIITMEWRLMTSWN